jgi:hypothetical protein
MEMILSTVGLFMKAFFQGVFFPGFFFFRVCTLYLPWLHRHFVFGSFNGKTVNYSI